MLMIDWVKRRGQIKHLLYEHCLNGRITKELLREQFKDLNNVEPVKHGRWEESWGGKWHSCSICGGIPPFNMRGDDMPTPYCPHCGAKMDLDEVEEDGR